MRETSPRSLWNFRTVFDVNLATSMFALLAMSSTASKILPEWREYAGLFTAPNAVFRSFIMPADTEMES